MRTVTPRMSDSFGTFVGSGAATANSITCSPFESAFGEGSDPEVFEDLVVFGVVGTANIYHHELQL